MLLCGVMENELLEIIAIDESGITSFKGYSVYAFVFIQLKDYVFISQYILKLEQELGLDYIHRHEMSWTTRLKIIEKIKLLNFTVEAVAYQNPINPLKCLNLALILKISKINSAYKIFIDGRQSKKYIEKNKKILKVQGLKNYQIKFVNDASEPLLRLADFMAGSVRSYLNNPTYSENKKFYIILKSKINHIHKTK